MSQGPLPRRAPGTFREVLHRDELVALIFIASNQILCGNYCLGAIRAEGEMSAIVEQDHIAAVYLMSYFIFDHCRWRGVPVISGHVPHHGLQSEFASDLDRRRASSSERRTKQIRMLADCVFQGVATVDELPVRFGFRFKNQQGMGEGVIADDVSGLRDCAGNFEALL